MSVLMLKIVHDSYRNYLTIIAASTGMYMNGICTKCGERDFELMWLQEEDSLNTRREHITHC